jgi:hypothetical protein
MVTIPNHPIQTWAPVQLDPEKADWWKLSRTRDLSLECMYRFKNYIHWYPLNFRRRYKYILLDHFPDKIHWNSFSQVQELSHPELVIYRNKVNWRFVSEYQILGDGSIREFAERLDWFRITYYQTLSDAVLGEFQSKIYWKYVAQRQNLSQISILQYATRLDWGDICRFQHLTEHTLEQCMSQQIDLLDWDLILENNPLLSSQFLYRHRVILFPHDSMCLFRISSRLAYLRMVLAINRLQRRWKRIAYAPGGKMYMRIFLRFQEYVNYEMGKKMKAPV